MRRLLVRRPARPSLPLLALALAACAPGSQYALHMAFNHRDLFKGCLATGCTVTQMKDNVANQRMSFLLYGGEFDQIVKGIADSRIRLAEKRYPAFYRQMEKRGREYLREKEDIPEALRWLETLDMQ